MNRLETLAAVIALTVALCPDPACDPANYKTCAKCTGLLEAAFPRCDDPSCDACWGAAEAARADR